jgi:hypothetical protein
MNNLAKTLSQSKLRYSNPPRSDDGYVEDKPVSWETHPQVYWEMGLAHGLDISQRWQLTPEEVREALGDLDPDQHYIRRWYGSLWKGSDATAGDGGRYHKVVKWLRRPFDRRDDGLVVMRLGE